ADSTSRFLTIRRVNNGGRVLVQTRPGDHLEGGPDVRFPRNSDANVLALNSRWDYVTLVSDGENWFVFAHGR
ncbi:MAG: hypothetical protein ACLGHP_06915, partial [Vicinamibacteria bacterium]